MEKNAVNGAAEQAEAKIEQVMEATERLANGPLDKLIDRLSKTADSTYTAEKAFHKFTDDVLTAITKRAVEGLFENLSQGGNASQPKENKSLLGGLIPAILPQAFYGTQAGGAPSVQVSVHNNTAASARVQERTDSRGRREIEIMIDNMVANSLAQGSQTRSVLRSVFGLDNLLKMR